MSTPHEASLTEKERAILAGLAAQAEADDPTLAAALRGRARRSGPPVRDALRVPSAVQHWAWGAVLAVAGLVVMVVSVATVVGFGVLGALMAFAGTYRVAVAHPAAVATRTLVDVGTAGPGD